MLKTRAVALGLTALLGAGAVTACGSSSDDSSSTPKASTTVPGGKLAATVASPKLGYYAGVDCGSLSSGTCLELSQSPQAREGIHTYCSKGKPRAGARSSVEVGGREYNFLCFTLQTSNGAADFWHAEKRIVKNVHVSGDRFPLTCEDSHCVQGEWHSTTKLDGRIRSQNNQFVNYRAEWVAAL